MYSATYAPVTDLKAKRPISCPIWKRPLLVLTKDGVEVRCQSCRHGVVHTFSKELLVQMWQELEKLAEEK